MRLIFLFCSLLFLVSCGRYYTAGQTYLLSEPSTNAVANDTLESGTPLIKKNDTLGVYSRVYFRGKTSYVVTDHIRKRKSVAYRYRFYNHDFYGYRNIKASTTKASTTNTSTTNTSNNSSGCASVQCSASTQKGGRCKRITTNCSGRCWQH